MQAEKRMQQRAEYTKNGIHDESKKARVKDMVETAKWT